MAFSRRFSVVIHSLSSAIVFLAFSTQSPAESKFRFNAFGSSDSAPISIHSARLEVEEDTEIAVFMGDVRVLQGDGRMEAEQLTVHFSNPENEDVSVLSARAEGGVTITDGSVTVKGPRVDWDAGKNSLVVGDTVEVIQGRILVRGYQLHVNTETGQARVIGDPEDPNSRVKTLLSPQ